MNLTLRPKTPLGKLSVWSIVYFLVSWLLLSYLAPETTTESRSLLDWTFFIIAVSGMVGAFISMVSGLIAIVWQEDRSLLGIFFFLVSIPIVVLLASFLLGSYVG